MAFKFEYQDDDRSVESITRRAQVTGGYDTITTPEFSTFRPKEGENIIRILPRTWGKDRVEKWGDDWAIDIFVHYNVGPDKSAYLCLDKMRGEPCPVCEARLETRDDEEKKQLKWSHRRLCYVVDRNEESKGPQVFIMAAKKLAGEIQTRSVNKKTNTTFLIDRPEDGYDVTFNREGTDDRTDYRGVEIDRDPSPIHESEKKQDAWLKMISDNPLPDILVYYDYEYIKEMLYGKIDRREEPEEDNRSSRSRRSRDSDDGDEDGEREERSSRRPSRDDAGEGRSNGRARRKASERDEETEVEQEDKEAQEDKSRRARQEEPEDDSRSSRSRRSRDDREDENNEDPPSEGRAPRREGRSRRREEPEGPEEDSRSKEQSSRRSKDDDDSPTEQARRGLERMRGRRT